MKNTKRTFKKIASALVVLVMAMSAVLPVWATTTYDTKIALGFVSATAQKGSTAALKLDITNTSGSQITDMSISLQYDATALAYNSSSTRLPDTSYTVTTSSGILTLRFDAPDASKNIGASASVQLMFDVLSTTTSSNTSVALITSPAPSIKSVSGTTEKTLTIDTVTSSSAVLSISGTAGTAASEAKLSKIEVGINNTLSDEIILKPAFSPDVYDYTMEIPYNTSPVVQATPASGAVCTAESKLGGDSDDYSAIFYFNVKNADGTKTNRYTVKVYVASAGAFTTTTTAPTTSEPQPTETTTTAPIADNDTSSKDSGDKTLELSMWAVIGLVGAEIALFLLAFFAGFKSRENSEKAQELIKAQIESQNPQNKQAPVMVMPFPMMPGQMGPNPNMMLPQGMDMNMMPPLPPAQPEDPAMQMMSKQEQILQNQLRRREMEMGIPNMDDAAIDQMPLENMNGMPMGDMNGMPMDGMPMGDMNGMPMDGMNGMPMGGMPMDGMGGMPMGDMNGMPMDGMGGMPMNGMPMDGMGGMPMDAMPMGAQNQYDPYGNLISYDANGQQIQYDQFGNQL
ncbi:MAG: hypothetical protein J6L81_01405 [Clostridia bacterium]|nr:hypothetical protein [Clostridia bacterium]